ncbi:diacylglycerol/lipid kinase family protein [Gracilimonas mengyeensis]|uniref:Diacylglycerol kinase (ATP) n=1 Tax=Gracilimonas mengyeensis TaxID=1302730 RepID=A0A521AQI8_9BACT|nr:YegS/Rv2252/BmrU family lipid kinase [Gracilimonas mengyeensis]SMO37055.1 diacylglycerol kinase (ATP) [Gracilimonas mengyeensis]
MSRKSTYCFIINGASNAERAVDAFRKYEAEIIKEVPDAHIVYVKKGESIKEQAREMAQKFSHIIACGGDGTVHLVANGMMDSEAVLGVIPIGSGNDFARQLGLNGSVKQAIETLFTGKLKTVDVIQFDDNYVLNTLGFGVDGLTNYYANRSKLKTGALRYFHGGLKALFRARPFEIALEFDEMDTVIHQRSWMVTLANGNREGGRYVISPRSRNDDGILEVLVVKDIAKWRLFYEFIKLSVGIAFNPDVVDTYSIQTGGALKSSRRVKTHADGEQIAAKNICTFHLLKSKISVICVS